MGQAATLHASVTSDFRVALVDLRAFRKEFNDLLKDSTAAAGVKFGAGGAAGGSKAAAEAIKARLAATKLETAEIVKQTAEIRKQAAVKASAAQDDAAATRTQQAGTRSETLELQKLTAEIKKQQNETRAQTLEIQRQTAELRKQQTVQHGLDAEERKTARQRATAAAQFRAEEREAMRTRRDAMNQMRRDAEERDRIAKRTAANHISAQKAARKELAEKASTAATWGGAGIWAGLGLAVNESVKFEESFTGVKKTVDATDAQLANIQQRLRKMTIGKDAVPINVNELNAIAEAAGQLDIKTPAIVGFARVIADLGATTNLTTNQAAEDLARLANITQMPQDRFDRLGSTVVHLGNKSAATERDIVSMGLRIAGAGKQVGMSEAEILAYAAALSSVGIESEAGGSSISRVFVEIDKSIHEGGKKLNAFAALSGMTTAQFKREFKDNAAGAVASFIEGLDDLKKSGGNVFQVMDKLGLADERVRDTLNRTAGAGKLLRKTLDEGRAAWERNTALTDEAGKRYGSTGSKIKVFQNELRDFGITTGTVLIPALTELMKEGRVVLEWFRDLDPSTQTAIVKFTLFGGAVLLVAGQIVKVIEVAALARIAFAKTGTAAAVAGGAGGVGFLTKSLLALRALAVNPITISVAAGAAIGAVGYEGLRQTGVLNKDEYRSIGEIVSDPSGRIAATAAATAELKRNTDATNRALSEAASFAGADGKLQVAYAGLRKRINNTGGDATKLKQALDDLARVRHQVNVSPKLDAAVKDLMLRDLDRTQSLLDKKPLLVQLKISEESKSGFAHFIESLGKFFDASYEFDPGNFKRELPGKKSYAQGDLLQNYSFYPRDEKTAEGFSPADRRALAAAGFRLKPDTGLNFNIPGTAPRRKAPSATDWLNPAEGSLQDALSRGGYKPSWAFTASTLTPEQEHARALRAAHASEVRRKRNANKTGPPTGNNVDDALNDLNGDKATKKTKEQIAAEKMLRDNLQDTARHYESLAKSAEDSARRQLSALEKIHGSLSNIFGTAQESLLQQGIVSDPLGPIITSMEKLLNLGPQAMDILAGTAGKLDGINRARAGAQSQLDALSGGDGAGVGYTKTAGKVTESLLSEMSKSLHQGSPKLSCAYFASNLVKELGLQVKGTASAGDLRKNAMAAGWQRTDGRDVQKGDLIFNRRNGGSGWHVKTGWDNGTVMNSNHRELTNYRYDPKAGDEVYRAPGKARLGNAGRYGSADTGAGVDLQAMRETVKNLMGGLGKYTALPAEWGKAVKSAEGNTSRFAAQMFLADKANQQMLVNAMGPKGFAAFVSVLRQASNQVDAVTNRGAELAKWGESAKAQYQSVKNLNIGLQDRATMLAHEKRLLLDLNVTEEERADRLDIEATRLARIRDLQATGMPAAVAAQQAKREAQADAANRAATRANNLLKKQAEDAKEAAKKRWETIEEAANERGTRTQQRKDDARAKIAADYADGMQRVNDLLRDDALTLQQIRALWDDLDAKVKSGVLAKQGILGGGDNIDPGAMPGQEWWDALNKQAAGASIREQLQGPMDAFKQLQESANESLRSIREEGLTPFQLQMNDLTAQTGVFDALIQQANRAGVNIDRFGVNVDDLRYGIDAVRKSLIQADREGKFKEVAALMESMRKERRLMDARPGIDRDLASYRQGFDEDLKNGTKTQADVDRLVKAQRELMRQRAGEDIMEPLRQRMEIATSKYTPEFAGLAMDWKKQGFTEDEIKNALKVEQWVSTAELIRDGVDGVFEDLFSNIMEGGDDLFGNLLDSAKKFLSNMAMEFLRQQSQKWIGQIVGAAAGGFTPGINPGGIDVGSVAAAGAGAFASRSFSLNDATQVLKSTQQSRSLERALSTPAAPAPATYNVSFKIDGSKNPEETGRVVAAEFEKRFGSGANVSRAVTSRERAQQYRDDEEFL